MANCVIMTNKGPVLMETGSGPDIRLFFGGVEYTVQSALASGDIPEWHKREGEKGGKKSLSNEEAAKEKYLRECIDLGLSELQERVFGKPSSKKKRAYPVLLASRRENPGKIERRHAGPSNVADIILAGFSELFRQSLFSTKKEKEKGKQEYAEGEFSYDLVFHKRHSKPIEPLAAYEVEDQYMRAVVQKIVFGDKETQISEDALLVPPQSQEILLSEEDAASKLFAFEKGFFKSELAYILGLARNKKCIEELGEWIYNKEYKAVFDDLERVIDMFIQMFTEKVGSRMIKEAESIRSAQEKTGQSPSESKIEYVSAGDVERGSRPAYSYLSPIDSLNRVQKEGLLDQVLEKSIIPFREYLEKVECVIYSQEFIEHIKKIEECIARYKKISSAEPEIAAVEQRTQCNVSFLFVSMYHRVLNYKMYTEEALGLLQREVPPKKHSTCADGKEKREICVPEKPQKEETVREEKDIISEVLDSVTGESTQHPTVAPLSRPRKASLTEYLQKYILNLSELLASSERYKKIKQLIDKSTMLPDSTDDFVELLELVNGEVLITKENLLIIQNNVTRYILSKKEIACCTYTVEHPENEEAAGHEFVDIASASIYPPAQDWVVDCINGTRMHWIRLFFKWHSSLVKFVRALRTRFVSPVALLEMPLKKHSFKPDWTHRDRIGEKHVLRSHRRMLVVREQKKCACTTDLYTYGQKRRLSEQNLFKIKELIDTSLKEYAEILESGSSSARAYGYAKQLKKEVEIFIHHHAPAHKSPYTSEQNEFSGLSSPYSLRDSVRIYLEYLSYVFRLLGPAGLQVFSRSGMNALNTVTDIRDPTTTNDEFLQTAISCAPDFRVPEDMNRNEFLLALLVIRFFTISAPDISHAHYMALIYPFFIYHLHDLSRLPNV